jgi:5,6,7,8-tetrahydromethanopterin hydro-lyase
MTPDYLFHSGEATVYAREGQFTDAMLQRALANEPTVDELIANRHKVRHDIDDRS